MKQQIATTNIQSDRLLRYGVPAESADMYIDNYNALWAVPIKDCARKNEEGFAPAWSLSCLLSLIPNVIEVDDDADCYFCLAQDIVVSEEYSASYLECWTAEHEAIVRKQDNNPIEACVQLIEWLVANGYKLNEIEKGGSEQ